MPFAPTQDETRWNALVEAINAFRSEGETDDYLALETAVEALPLPFRERAYIWRLLILTEPKEAPGQTAEQYDALMRAEMASMVAFHMERLETTALADGKPKVAPDFDGERFTDSID